MHKIILVIDNPTEKDFLDRLLRKLGFTLLSTTQGQSVAEQLASFVPDIVFASMIGKKSNTLQALGKVKASRGIPKVVFVRSEKENKPLTGEQKQIVDGLLASPIDPFQLLEVLSVQLGIDLEDLKAKYKKLMFKEKDDASDGPMGHVLIVDQQRRDKYSKIIQDLGDANKNHGEFDFVKYRKIKKEQAKSFKNDEQQSQLKKSFIKTLFSATVKS